MTESDLSYRLKAISNMVTAGNVVYDVGCDHAYLAIWLVKNGISPKAYASDVRTGPLKAAEENIAAEELSDRIETVLSDGLHNINNPPELSSLCIAGMGGKLILQILGDDKAKTHMFGEIIISPQSQIEEVRDSLEDLGLYIIDEDLIEDQDKYYCIMKLAKKPLETLLFPENIQCDQFERDFIINRYGPTLIVKKPDTLKEFLIKEHKILSEIRQKLDKTVHFDKIKEVERDIRINELLTGGLYGND